jgi:hypothetical protein
MAGAKKATRKRAPERRRWPRLPLAIPVFVRGVDYHGRKFQEFCALLNVSEGGALLVTRTSLRPGTMVSVEIPIPPWFCKRTWKIPLQRFDPSRFYYGRVRIHAEDSHLDAENGYCQWGMLFPFCYRKGTSRVSRLMASLLSIFVGPMFGGFGGLFVLILWLLLFPLSLQGSSWEEDWAPTASLQVKGLVLGNVDRT